MAVLGLVIDSVLSLIILLVSKCLWNYFRSPLKAFPGPFPTHFTNLWRLLDVYRGRCDITHINLHRKHGRAVRMGPDIVSLSDPNLIKTVFSTKKPWKKVETIPKQALWQSTGSTNRSLCQTNMVSVNDVMIDGQRVSNLFGTRDEEWHDAKLKPIKSLYSMTKVQDFEANVDLAINLFVEKLQDRFIKPGNSCDMADYLGFCTSWILSIN